MLTSGGSPEEQHPCWSCALSQDPIALRMLTSGGSPEEQHPCWSCALSQDPGSPKTLKIIDLYRICFYPSDIINAKFSLRRFYRYNLEMESILSIFMLCNDSKSCQKSVQFQVADFFTFPNLSWQIH
jgi:hypothetical protein